ncbi:MAG: NAD(P)H-binding protein [Myxococcota bacterium]
MATPTDRVLVTGANGKLGRRLLQRLCDTVPSTPARALVRSRRAADSLADLSAKAGFEVRVADYADTQAMVEVAQDCTAAIHLVGILKETRNNRYAAAHEQTARALVAAADAAGLRRIVHISIHGADPSSANPCLASRGRSDAILLAARTPALILRVPMVLGAGDAASAALRRAVLSGGAMLVGGGKSLEQPIAARDVVAALCAGLDGRGLDDSVLELAGPESLPHRALLERAARLSGRQIRFRSLPASLARAGAYLAEKLLAEPPITRAMLGVLQHDDRVDAAPAARALGIDLSPLDDALRECLASEEAA